MKSTPMSATIRVGDHVRFDYGAREVLAEVIEDRGPIGVGGRQIIRVRLIGDEWHGAQLDFEVPAEQVTPVTAA